MTSDKGLRLHQARYCGKPQTVKPRCAPIVSASFVESEKYTPEVGAVVMIDGQEVPARRAPGKDDRHNAERLAGLPWIKYPVSVDGCDSVLDGIARAEERYACGHPFWSTLKAHIQELRRRLAPVAA